MAAFSRGLTESLSIQDFVNVGGNFGLGVYAFLPVINSIALGMETFQGAMNQAALGMEQPSTASLFSSQGEPTPVYARIFDPQGDATHRGANMFDPQGDGQPVAFGIDFPRSLSETLAIVDAVDINGSFTRFLTETLMVQARAGQAKALFFRHEISNIVTANSEVRQLLELQDSGEIAASERPLTGPLKVLRYAPGSTVGSPNTINLGAVPTNVGSQGFIFDNSPQGVFLRGAWEVKLVVQDTTALGTYQVHVNLFVVTASTTGVARVVQAGPTKTSSPISPSTTPAQITFTWPANEVGEVFIDTDQYMYVETFIEELTHPGSLSYAKLRLSDLPQTLFSQLQYPGVTTETTYYLEPNDENLAVSDTVARIKGFNRSLIESLTVLEDLARTVGFQRSLSDAISISDSLFAAVNVLYETLSISDSLARTVANFRALTETLSILDSLTVNVPSEKKLFENLLIEDFVQFSIQRPPRPARVQGINKRPLDSIKRFSVRRRG